jgi:hypothetical protein
VAALNLEKLRQAARSARTPAEPTLWELVAEFRAQARAQQNEVFDASHPIAVGATVTVLKLSQSVAPAIEGVAVIEGVAPGKHEYLVRFLGDPSARKRVVHHDYQENPEQFLEMLRDLWRASNTPQIEEFFPDTND